MAGYYLEFGNFIDKQIAYIFKYSVFTDSNTGNKIYKYAYGEPIINVTGNADAFKLRVDCDDEKDLTVPIIRQSLQVSFVRQNDTDFNNIISSDDKSWMAVILKGGKLIYDNGYIEVAPLTVGVKPKVLFIGTLVSETYGEDYLPIPSVNLTFFDGIGELSDIYYSPRIPIMPVKDILADLLNTANVAHDLVIEFPYSWNEATQNPQSGQGPTDIALDVSDFEGKTKLETLEQLLHDFGLQLQLDYSLLPSENGGSLYDVGCVRVKHIASHTNLISEYYLYKLRQVVSGTTTWYVYDEQTTTSIVGETVLPKVEFVMKDLYFYLSTTPIILFVINFRMTVGGNSVIKSIYALGNNTGVISNAQALAAGVPADQFWVHVPTGDFLGPATPSQVMRDFVFGFNRTVGASTYISYGAIKILQDNGNHYDILSPLAAPLGQTPQPATSIIIQSKIGSSDYNIAFAGNPAILYKKVIGYYNYTNYNNGQTTIVNRLFEEQKNRVVMNSPLVPIINRSGRWELSRKAKQIDATVEYVVADDIMWPSELVDKYFKGYSDAKGFFNLVSNYFLEFPSKTDGNSYGDIALKKWVVDGATSSGNRFGRAVSLKSGKIGFPIILDEDVYDIYECRNRSYLTKAVTVTKKTGDLINLSVSAVGEVATNRMMATLLAVYGESIYSFNGTSWVLTEYGTTLNFLVGTSETTESISSIPMPTEIPENEPFLIMLRLGGFNTPAEYKPLYCTGYDVTISSGLDFPKKLELTTIINQSTRKPVKLESVFCNLPINAAPAAFYRNGIYTNKGYPLATLNYRGLEQTLLAHVSDQLGANYAKDRWIFEGTIKVEDFRLFDLFELDFRVFQFQSGSYDMKRGYLQGTWVEIVELGRLSAWQWPDNTYILWNDGGRILL